MLCIVYYYIAHYQKLTASKNIAGVSAYNPAGVKWAAFGFGGLNWREFIFRLTQGLGICSCEIAKLSTQLLEAVPGGCPPSPTMKASRTQPQVALSQKE